MSLVLSKKPEGWDDLKAGEKLVRINDKLKEVISPIKANIVKTPHIGILRLDYHYPARAGDVVSKLSFDYGCVYKSVKGLTFEMVQQGMDAMNVETLANLNEAIAEFDEHEHVVGVTGSCGFMLYLQQHCKNKTKNKPVFLSSLMLGPLIERSLTNTDHVLVLTANSESLTDVVLRKLLHEVAKMPADRTEKFSALGCQNVEGFGKEVELGERVDFDEAEQPLLDMVAGAIQAKEQAGTHIAALLLECTELPQFSNSLRARFNLPVFDVITLVDTFHSSTAMSTRFGRQTSKL